MMCASARWPPEVGADLVVLDPALPLGLVGPSLELPYDVVLHGAEVTVPGRLPVSRQVLGHVLRNARHIVAGGSYPAAEAEHAAGRALPITVVPPGVDIDRFVPLDDGERARRAPALRPAGRRRADRRPSAGSCRARASTPRSAPRPGCAARRPDLVLAISGSGRDERAAAPAGRRARRPGALPRPGPQRRPARALRLRRRLRHAVPQPVGRPRAGGLRHRLRRGRGVRRAAGGRRRRAGRPRPSPTARPASSCAARRIRSTSPRRSPGCSTTRPRRERMGEAARARAVAEFSYDVLAERLGHALGALP